MAPAGAENESRFAASVNKRLYWVPEFGDLRLQAGDEDAPARRNADE